VDPAWGCGGGAARAGRRRVTAAVRGKEAVVRAKAAGAMVIDGSVGAPCTTGIPEGAVHCTPAKYAADAAAGGAGVL